METKWILFAAVLIALEDLVSARVCVLGTAADESEGGRVRFFLPPGDPCSCTEFMMGGHNAIYLPRKDYHVIDFAPMDDRILRTLFGCVESNSTEAVYTHDALTNVTSAAVQSTSDSPLPYTDCQKILDAGYNTSGVYTILHERKAVKLYCDMDSTGGHIVIQRRTDGSVAFNRSWAEYRDGFGNLEGEFWWGNENLRRFTDISGQEHTWKLTLTLRAFDGDFCLLQYGEFKVNSDTYNLQVNGHKDLAGERNAGDSLDDISFSTYDNDNDHDNTNCAKLLQGGWWFRKCSNVRSNLNGEYMYPDSPNELKKGRGIVWKSWKGHKETLMGSEMKIQRNV